jgi:enoyl-CoA hydratase/carnithine racemase
MTAGDEVRTTLDPQSYVGVIELNRPPNNFLDISLLRAVCAAMESLDETPGCRAIVLAAAGKHFCAGRDFSKPRGPGDDSASVYREAGRLLGLRTPFVAAVQGAAIGAGLGLALCADFRLCSTRAYFTANFARLGLHHGFGLSVTLPRVIGLQRASELLYTGDKIGADYAAELGLVDRVCPEDTLRDAAVSFAARLAEVPPLAAQSIRATLRASLNEQFRAATEHESAEQARLSVTADAKEAAAAARERRPGRFHGV